jgi:hypothetical protein
MNRDIIRWCLLISHILAGIVWCVSFAPPIVSLAVNKPDASVLWFLAILWPFSYAIACFAAWRGVRKATHHLLQVACIAFLFAYLFAAIVFLLSSLRWVLR